MAAINCNSLILCCGILSVFLARTCNAVKCFDCNSANNSACLDMHLAKMNAIVPVVDCTRAIPNAISKQFFCRKITQTILSATKSPETRITRGCGWIKHKRECYTADNKDHLETVCQCFGDMCNAATALNSQYVAAGIAALIVWMQTVYLRVRM